MEDEIRQGKCLFASAARIRCLAAEYPTPFFLYNEAGIRRSVETLLDAFSWNSGFREFYAVKACPNPAIITVLREYGCGLDCASVAELSLAQRMGVMGREVMFSSNVTPADAFRVAAGLGATINFDDVEHLSFFEEAVGELPDVVSLRYNPGALWDGGDNAIFGAPEGSKFGMMPDQLLDAARYLANRGHTSFGLHALIASNALGESYYPRLAQTLFEAAVTVHRETGLRPSFINLSGGIGIPYRPGEPEVDLSAVGEAVRHSYEDVLVAAGIDDVALYTELGRYLTGPHGYLVTRVLHVKRSYHDYAGVDAGTADLLRPAMYGAYHHITALEGDRDPVKPRDRRLRRYDVVGGLCENNDRLADGRLLPQVDVGDLLVVHDAGAHGYSMGHNYNGHLRCAEVLLHPDGSSSLIRRPETIDDYLATLDVLGEEFGRKDGRHISYETV